MREECLCPYCTAGIEESGWYFALFCEKEVDASWPVATAPTLHLDHALVQYEFECLLRSMACEEEDA